MRETISLDSWIRMVVLWGYRSWNSFGTTCSRDVLRTEYHSRKPRLKQSNTKVFVGLIPYHSTDKLYRRGASDVARFVLLGLGKYFALSRNEEYHSLRAGYRCHQHLVLCLPYSRQRLVALPFSYPERRCWLNRRGAERCHQAPERRSDQYNTFSDPQMSFVSASRERCTNQ
ncbi:hypothetical protein BDR05DRAFT_616313 [Suillus weaverae]|nr:hypothetical protein BDR05DRAFT_616313 [Suillus weaverae]